MRLEICSLPPLKLKFEKADLQKHGLSPLNEMDIVEPCHDDDTYDQCLLKEYMAYKLWNWYRHIISGHSSCRYITPILMAQRHMIHPMPFLWKTQKNWLKDSEAVETRPRSSAAMPVDKEPMLMVALFEFMIGNTDWFIQNRHNLEFVVIPGHSFLVTIPYDFDYSGLVAASYAAHHESLNQRQSPHAITRAGAFRKQM